MNETYQQHADTEGHSTAGDAFNHHKTAVNITDNYLKKENKSLINVTKTELIFFTIS